MTGIFHLALGITSLGAALASVAGFIWLCVAMYDDHPTIPVMIFFIAFFTVRGVFRFIKNWRRETREIIAYRQMLYENQPMPDGLPRNAPSSLD